MSIVSIIITIIVIFVLLISIQVIFHTKKPIKKFVLGSFKGIAAFIAVNLAGIITGITLPVSLLSLAIAIIGGLPGVTTMIILDMIL